MKIILWIGNAPNHLALASKVAEVHEVTGMVIQKSGSGKGKWRNSINALAGRLFTPGIDRAWMNLQSKYLQNYPNLPACEALEIENINDKKTFEFCKNLDADYVLVSGTALVKNKALFNLSHVKGILNLHTGLSPYVKGGPNCTNWCLAEGRFDLIGNTVMWLDQGIDSGDILTSERISLNGNDLSEIHWHVMEKAHELVLSSLEAINEGRANRVPQKEIGKGRTFYTRQWNLKKRLQLLRNLKGFHPEKTPISDVVIVPLKN